jgi:hypothetical protein
VKRKKAFQACNNRLQDDFQALASYDLHEKQLVSGLGLVNTMTQTTLLGKRLHKRRTEQGLSLRALAEKPI